MYYSYLYLSSIRKPINKLFWESKEIIYLFFPAFLWEQFGDGVMEELKSQRVHSSYSFIRRVWAMTWVEKLMKCTGKSKYFKVDEVLSTWGEIA